MRAPVVLGIILALIVGAFGGYEFALHHRMFGKHGSEQPATTSDASDSSNANSASGQSRPPQVREAARAMHQACSGDIANLCKDATTDRGAIPRCLRSHEDQLSAACKTAWENLKAARQAARGSEGGQGAPNTAPAQ